MIHRSGLRERPVKVLKHRYVDLLICPPRPPEVRANTHGPAAQTARHSQAARESAAPEHILITGGTGFLGAELIRRLCTGTSAHLWVLSRANRKATAEQRVVRWIGPEYRSRITVVEGELGRPFLGLDDNPDASARRTYEELLENCDAIFHNGSDLSFASSNTARERIFNVNVGGTARVLGLAARFRRPLKAFNYTSTAFVHGTQGEGEVFLEENTIPTSWINPYEESKWRAESLIAASGLPYRIFRPSIIARENEAECLSFEGMYRIADLLRQGAGLAARHGSANEVMEIACAWDVKHNFILRSDAADLMVKLCAAPGSLNRRYNIVSAENTPMRFLFDAIASNLGIRYRLVDEVRATDPLSRVFRSRVAPPYEKYFFKSSPAFDRSNVIDVLGREDVERRVSSIGAAMLRSLIGNHYERTAAAVTAVA